MQTLEKKKNLKMLKLMIDKEKREIVPETEKPVRSRTKSSGSYKAKSEHNASVHSKLYADSKTRSIRLKETKQKHILDELTSMSIDNEKRDKFFVPKINDCSKRLASNKRDSKNEKSTSPHVILYEDAVKRK